MFSINVASITSPARLSHRMAAGIALGLALAGLTLTISPARAQAEGCPSAPLSQPFSKFNDTNWYELVPNGDFEGSTAGWTLSGKAALASGSESYAVTGKLGKSSLELPAGASATSPFMCVDKSYRTMRFFARSEGGSSSVSVQVLYKTPNGPYVLELGADGKAPHARGTGERRIERDRPGLDSRDCQERPLARRRRLPRSAHALGARVAARHSRAGKEH